MKKKNKDKLSLRVLHFKMNMILKFCKDKDVKILKLRLKYQEKHNVTLVYM